MTYGCCPGECSGTGRGWQPFWLNNGEIAGQLPPLESPLQMSLVWDGSIAAKPRCCYASNSHDDESIHSRFPKPCKHCMTLGVHHENRRKEWPLPVSFRSPSLPIPEKPCDGFILGLVDRRERRPCSRSTFNEPSSVSPQALSQQLSLRVIDRVIDQCSSSFAK